MAIIPAGSVLGSKEIVGPAAAWWDGTFGYAAGTIHVVGVKLTDAMEMD